jgi:hypothetical protein
MKEKEESSLVHVFIYIRKDGNRKKQPRKGGKVVVRAGGLSKVK